MSAFLNPPFRNTNLHNVRKYQNTGTSLNRNKANSGRRNIEKHCAVRELLEANPHLISRRNPVEVAQAIFNRITRHPYRMHGRHELLEIDLPRPLRSSDWLTDNAQTKTF